MVSKMNRSCPNWTTAHIQTNYGVVQKNQNCTNCKYNPRCSDFLNICKMVRKSKSIFNARTKNNQLNNIFGSSSYAGFGNTAPTYQVALTSLQLASLQLVYDNYAVMLANKSYERIPNSYATYIDLLNQLKSINLLDYKLQLLINIAETSLMGSLNANSLYTSFAFNEIKVALLNKRIKEILSDKNVKETMGSASGQICITKTFKLSPLLSYYIYLYGMPAFGVGFDPAKLAFVQSLPAFRVADQIDTDTVKWPYKNPGAPPVKPAFDSNGNPIVHA
jgi:hypothetical protein